MSADPQKPIAQMPMANMPEILKTEEIEEEIEQLRFRTTTEPDMVTKVDALSGKKKTADNSKAAIDACMRTGEVMKALFPDGLCLKNEEEFAIFRLFDRLVGDMAHFALTGMTQPASLRDISLHAMLLENVISSKGRS